MKIFFSYGHDKNTYIVDLLKNDLTKRGYEVWVDQSEIRSGDDWRRAISQGINESDMVMSFASKHAFRDRGVCFDELSIAVAVKGAQIQSILLEKNVDVPKNVSYRQFLDMSDWEAYKDTDQFDSWYQEKLNELLRIIEDPATKKYEEEIQYLKVKFNPSIDMSYKATQSESIYCGRKWLVDIINNWFDSSDKKKILALTGSPGSGKSTFISHEFIYNKAVAAVVYCKWDNTESNSLDSVSRSLIFQTAARYADYRYFLVDLLRREELAGQSMAESDGVRLFDRYFLKPLKSLINGERQELLILIDGIDEVENQSGEWRSELVKLITSSAKDLPSWIYFLITSRNDNKVLLALGDAERINIDDWQEQNRADVSTYIDLCLDTNYDRRTDAKIKRKCDGNFQYAVLLCEALNKGIISVSEIDSIPETLSSLYYTHFSRIFTDRKEYRQKYRPILSAICASVDLIPSDTIYNVLEWDNYDKQEFLLKMSAYFQNSKEFKVFHRSLIDWLMSDESLEYGIVLKEGRKLIAEGCYFAYQEDPKGMNDYELSHLLASLFVTKHPAYEEILGDSELAETLLQRADEQYHAKRYGNAMTMTEDALKIMEHNPWNEKSEPILLKSFLIRLNSCREEGKLDAFAEESRHLDELIEKYQIQVNEKNVDMMIPIWRARGKILRALNRWDESIRIYEEAESVLIKMNRNMEAIEFINQHALTCRIAKRKEDALRQYEKIESLVSMDELRTADPALYIIIHTAKAFCLQDIPKTEEATALLEECARLDQENPNLLTYTDQAQIYFILSYNAYMAGEYEKGLGYVNKALELRKKAYGKNAVEICSDLNEKGHILLKLNRMDECHECFRESLRLRTAYYGEHNIYTAFSLRNLAKYYEKLGDPESLEKAISILNEARQIWVMANDRRHSDVAMTLVDSAECLSLLGRFEQAEKNLSEAKDFYASVSDYRGMARCDRALGLLETRRQNKEKAAESYEEAIEQYLMSGMKDSHPNIVEIRQLLSELKS